MAVNFSTKVLIVDDYQTMVKIVTSLLKQIGFTDIEFATSGGDALEKLKKSEYGLVISDWNMQPMSGYELLQNIRGDKSLDFLPFIMVTAESKTQHVIAAKKAGANNYIIKPFNSQTLLNKIETVFA